MNLIFVSNILNHHQTALCQAFQRAFESFLFIATEKTTNFGYQVAQNADYMIQYQDNVDYCEQQISAADVVIFGACPNHLIDLRMQNNRLSFLYSERFLKKGAWRRYIPSVRKKIYERAIKHRDKEFYILCASAYLSYDLSLMGFPVEKCLKWGYLPETTVDDIDVGIRNKMVKKKINLLWVARLIPLKHPEHVLSIAKRLRNDGLDFVLRIVGDGVLYSRLERFISRSGLTSHVKLEGSKTPDEVRNYMKEADIFLFCSDFREGWGAVVNEAMNSGCAVVCSHAAGSAHFLLAHKQNGMIYKSKSVSDLYNCVRYLIDYPDVRISMSKQAYNTITNHWNADVAAKRFRSITDSLLRGKGLIPFEKGICSISRIIYP